MNGQGEGENDDDDDGACNDDFHHNYDFVE